eukprot:1740923-Alexandrium_andersonii.AAC.1
MLHPPDPGKAKRKNLLCLRGDDAGSEDSAHALPQQPPVAALADAVGPQSEPEPSGSDTSTSESSA